MLDRDTFSRRTFYDALRVAAVTAAFAFGAPAFDASVARAATDEEDIENPYDGDPEGIEYGRVRFGQRCGFCHGGGGAGAKGPDLTDDKWKYGGRNIDLFQNITGGIPKTQMGGFGTWLDGDEILKIMAYMRDENRKRHESGDLEDKK